MSSSLLWIYLWAINVLHSQPVTDQDIGCNYVNVGGLSFPVDYCMTVMYKGFDFGVQFVCNETWNGINLAVYDSSGCDIDPKQVLAYGHSLVLILFIYY